MNIINTTVNSIACWKAESAIEKKKVGKGGYQEVEEEAECCGITKCDHHSASGVQDVLLTSELQQR